MLLDLRSLYEDTDEAPFFDGAATPGHFVGRPVSRSTGTHSWTGKLRPDEPDTLRNASVHVRITAHSSILVAGADYVGHADFFRPVVVVMHQGLLISSGDDLHASRAFESGLVRIREMDDEDLTYGDV